MGFSWVQNLPSAAVAFGSCIQNLNVPVVCAGLLLSQVEAADEYMSKSSS